VNQQDIDKYLDNITSTAEQGIDRSFAATLKEILNEIARMYEKYASGDGTLTWTDMNKFNRLQQEMAAISGSISTQYQGVLKSLQSLTQNVYLENFMRSSYLYELAAQTALGVSVPSPETIQKVVQNPIDKLTLPALMQSHRTEIINKLHILISQSLMSGEGYTQMARRVQNAVGFSQAKARNVARTEAGRVQTLARLDSAEQAAKHADLQKVWMSTLDMRTRPDHRNLDGQEADKDGNFHIHEFQAKGPHLFGVAKEDCNCRCTFIMKVNGQLPDTRNARDYQDAGYQQKLADRMDKLMADEGMTQKQAEKQAKKDIVPPNKAIPFQSYDEWLTGKKKATPKKEDGPTIKMPDGSERAAVVDQSSGIPIIQPQDMDTGLQTLSIDDVKGFINQIPKEHQGVIKEIHLLDAYDQEGDQVFDSAVGGFDLKSKNIEIYRNDWLNKDTRNKMLAGTIRHETAHALQESLGDQFVKDWKKAEKKDVGNITDYAKTDIYEDIAETIMYFWSPDSIERRTVQFFFPERYAVLEKYGVKEGHNIED
jgi:phage putative head morphogenesis protein, SPP1 gp7 family